jgi:hypothetical protein
MQAQEWLSELSLMNTKKFAASRIDYTDIIAGFAARKRRKNGICVNSAITMGESN